MIAIRIMIDEYLGKDEKLYAAIMDLEKAYELIGKVFETF